MDLYNPHKTTLITAIDLQIASIDTECSTLINKIHLYSQARLDLLKKEYDADSQQLNSLKSTRNSHSKTRKDLLSTMQLLQQEQLSMERELTEKQCQNDRLQREIVFVEQKNKEQHPHIQSYLVEQSKSVRSNHNIAYAKNKLRQLEKVYEKQSQDVEYKYRLISVMKQQLKEIRVAQRQQQSIQSTIHQGQDPLASLDHSEEAYKCPQTVFPSYTEESQIKESLVCL